MTEYIHVLNSREDKKMITVDPITTILPERIKELKDALEPVAKMAPENGTETLAGSVEWGYYVDRRF
jgi:hypothetical protein